MSGSSFGKLFQISTWGESHGKALGVVIDGCPAGIPLGEEDIQKDLDRRKPGASKFTTKRSESDTVHLLSGVFEGVTTGAPISLLINNEDQKSKDYTNIMGAFRPGHSDYGYEMKYGFRDYRGGGRSSGRETVSRVAAGAVAKKLLNRLDIDISAYSYAIGNVFISPENFDEREIFNNPLGMPDKIASEKAAKIIEAAVNNCDSVGGIIQCVVRGVKPGIGEPVFEKLDAVISQGVFSIGGVKAVEFGLGTAAATVTGAENNDSFYWDNDTSSVKKRTNNAGGVLGGLSDGSDIVFRAYFKPTPSISQPQNTLNNNHENIEISINGRHDPVIVPRAIVVVEAMTALVLADYILQDSVSKIDNLRKLYGSK